MNREIKFRGKRGDNGGWTYGYFAIHHFSKTQTMPDGTIKIIGFEEIPMIFNDSKKSDGGYWKTVTPSTVGQYTGLKDNNGKEIYEGDIIEESDVIFEVCWYDDLAAYIAEMTCNERPFLMSDLDLKKCKVVGNIYDNPELLKNK